MKTQDLIVIDKPAGLVVHPGAGNETGTLVNALIAHCGDSLSGIGGVRRPGIVHRLDKETSGLLVVAKNDARTPVASPSSLPPMAATAGWSGAIWPSSGAFQSAIRGRFPPASAAAPPTARRSQCRAPPRPAKPLPTTRCLSASAIRPWPAWSAAASRPVAPTRSACIWRISDIRCWAIQPMVQGSGVPRLASLTRQRKLSRH